MIKDFLIKREKSDTGLFLKTPKQALLTYIINSIKEEKLLIQNIDIDSKEIRDNIANSYMDSTIYKGNTNIVDSEFPIIKTNLFLSIKNNDFANNHVYNLSIYFIVKNDIILFYSPKLYSSKLKISFNLNKQNNSFIRGVALLNNNHLFNISYNDYTNICSTGGFNSRYISTEFTYENVNYAKLFMTMFPLASVIDTSEFFIDHIMPIEYTERINEINTFFNFNKKTQSFLNPNSSNHLVYFYNNSKDFFTWKN